MSFADVIDTYGAAWNEVDSDARRTLLEVAWADDGAYADPTVHVFGREALVAHIGATHEVFGGFRIDRTSDYDEHHGYVRFTWTMKAQTGETLVDGFDVVRLSSDSRIELVVGFFGPFPAV